MGEIKARNAGNSRAIAKFCNDEIGNFGLKLIVHDLFRGSLVKSAQNGDISVQGDVTHPANFGRLCTKGTALAETISLEGRLLYPKVDGDRTSWEDALARVGTVFSETIAKYDPSSVAFYVSGQILTEDYYVANKLMKGFIGSANIDTNSRLCMASSVAGHKRAFGSDTVPGTYSDLERADLVVLVGSNLAWCHPVLFQRIFAARESRGDLPAVVVIDPRRTVSVDMADLHLAIKPDTDTYLFNGLLAYLIRQGKVDEDFIANHTEGFAAVTDKVSDIESEDVARVCGVSESKIRDFFSRFAATQKTVVVYSQGVNQSQSGTDKVNAIINCHLATGRIGRAGMGPFSVTGQPNAMGGREVGGLANMLAAHLDIENPTHRAMVQAFWDSPTIAPGPGFKAVELFQKVASGEVKALWIMGTNPVDSLCDTVQVEAALKQCPFLVVSDLIEQTDTAKYADILLPSLGWGEKEGTVTNSERYISRQRAFLPAPGEARPDWWQLAQVAKKMGFAEAFAYDEPVDIFKEHAALSGHDNADSRAYDISGLESMGKQDYQTLPPLRWPLTRAGQTKERFFADGKFYTANGRARFIVTATTPAARVSQIAFPLTLNTGRIRDQWHTMTRTGRSATLSRHLAEPFCEINSEDAKQYGIDDADLVRVYNSRGEIVVRALVSSRQQMGHVFVPMHWNDHNTANARVGKLIAPDVDPASGQPALKYAPVAIEKYSVSVYGYFATSQKIAKPNLPYWAINRIEGGYAMEFAINQSRRSLTKLVEPITGLEIDHAAASYIDQDARNYRFSWTHGGKIQAVLFLCGTPVSCSRNWLNGCIGAPYKTHSASGLLLLGFPAGNTPNPGAIICTCHAIGVNQIEKSIQKGNQTLFSLGEDLAAGTNCGSCRPELLGLINRCTLKQAS